MKKNFDLLVSLFLLVLIFPLLCAVALAVYLNDFGTVLFKQRRVGQQGGEFWLYKFRSMVINAEKLGGYSTQQGDTRITKVGRFIRKTSLDELPQLFNVLKGEMSLVGPRPDVPAQKSRYTEEEWQLRHSVRPGITGLAQATLRSAASEAERKQMDLYYAQNASFILDIKIMLMTVRQLLAKGKGVN